MASATAASDHQLKTAEAFLRYRHCLPVKVAFSPPVVAVNVAEWFKMDGDGNGTLAAVDPEQLFGRQLLHMGVELEAFVAARPAVVSVELGWCWGNEEEDLVDMFACGGLGESGIQAALSQSIAEKSQDLPGVRPNLYFFARFKIVAAEVSLEPIGTTTDLQCSLSFVPGMGVMVKDVEQATEAPGFAAFRPNAALHPSAHTTAYTDGTLITHVNGRRIAADTPQESFEALFKMRMYPFGANASKPHPTYVLTVRAPLCVVKAPPMLKQCLEEVQSHAWVTLRGRDTSYQKQVLEKEGWEGAVLHNSQMDGMLQNTRLWLQYRNTKPEWADSVDLWCEAVLYRAAKTYYEQGSLDRNLDALAKLVASEQNGSLLEVLMPPVSDEVVTKKRTDLSRSVEETYNAVVKVIKEKPQTHSLWFALTPKDLWRAGTRCPLCTASTDEHDSNAAHPGFHVIYGSFHNIDARRNVLGTRFLEPLGWHTWVKADIVLPLRGHPYHIPETTNSAMDIRFRAVIKKENYAAFEDAWAKFKKHESHATLDRTGDCVRAEWSWDARLREKKDKKDRKRKAAQMS